ncbi:hypothetical protein ZWY2020_037691 [Hordeum vulgare]|nr:hypothetical protein ZWY2020_037691 [Hordeum vulgare]
MDRLVIPEPTNEVVVRVEPGRAARGELTLRNAMHTMPVAFRLQPAVRGRFAAPDGPGGGGSRGEDAFLLHSVVAPGASVREPVSALDSVNPEWFSARKKQVFVDSGIRASFVGAEVAARLVATGAVEALREVLDRSDPAWRAADAADESGSTLLDLADTLEIAAASGECLIAELLLANGAKHAGSDALHVAAAAGHDDVLKLLLGKPASASPRSSSSSASFSGSFTSLDAAGREGKTPLRLAAEGGRRDAVKALLAAGARADARCGTDGGTALHAAARRGDEAVARLILAHGVAGTASVRDAKGKTAYETAAEEGHTGRIMDFLGLGEAILAAARKGEGRAVRRAADGGASVEGRDAHGWTPLMRAAFKGQADAVRDLIERGAEMGVRFRGTHGGALGRRGWAHGRGGGPPQGWGHRQGSVGERTDRCGLCGGHGQGQGGAVTGEDRWGRAEGHRREGGAGGGQGREHGQATEGKEGEQRLHTFRWREGRVEAATVTVRWSH